MKKNLIVGIAMAAGVLTMGAMSASAAESCNGSCTDQQSVHQFKQETSVLSGNVEALEAQIREQYSNDSIDIRKIEALEAQLKTLKDKIEVIALKHNISKCARG